MGMPVQWKAKGKRTLVAAVAAVVGWARNSSLGEGEGVTDMEVAVGVGVREGDDELAVVADPGLALVGLGLVSPDTVPHGLDLGLVGEEGVALRGALGGDR